MAQVHEPIDRELQPLGGAKIGDAFLGAMQHTPPWREPHGVASVEVDQLGAAGAREEQARLLEALANGGHVVVEAAGGEAEAATRLRIVETAAGGVRERVSLLDDAAGKDPGAAGVVAAFGPT